MRNKEQEEMYRGIVNKSKKEVQQHFKNIIDSIEFGAYIKPENYFVSYVFKTDEELEKAKLSGLTNKINKYHIKRLKRNKYPKEE